MYRCDFSEDSDRLLFRGPEGSMRARVTSGVLHKEIAWALRGLDQRGIGCIRRIRRVWTVKIPRENRRWLHLWTDGAKCSIKFLNLDIPRRLEFDLRDILTDHREPGARQARSFVKTTKGEQDHEEHYGEDRPEAEQPDDPGQGQRPAQGLDALDGGLGRQEGLEVTTAREA